MLLARTIETEKNVTFRREKKQRQSHAASNVS